MGESYTSKKKKSKNEQIQDKVDLKVFISAVMDELKSERLAAKTAIQEICLTPVMAEDFDPTRKSPEYVYSKKLKSSDIYVGIFGKKYSKHVREEFNISETKKKELILFVKKVGKRDEELNKFINELEEKKFLYKTFTDESDLMKMLQKSLINALSECYKDYSRNPLTIVSERIGEISNSWKIWDLTHQIEVVGDQGPLTIFRESTFPQAEERSLPPVYVQKEKRKVAEFMTTVLHHLYTNSATHIDFPGHIFSMAPQKSKKISEYPPELFIGPAVVLDVSDITEKLKSQIDRAGDFRGYLKWEGDKEQDIPKGYIEIIKNLKLDLKSFIERLEKANLSLEPGDFLLLHTGLDDYWKNWSFVNDAWEYIYFLNPYFSEELVDHLIELKLKGIGSDSFRLENPIINLGREIGRFESLIKVLQVMVPEQIKEFYDEATRSLMHHKMLKNEILLIEQMTNLDKIKGKKVLLIALPPKIGLDKCDKDMFVRAVAIDFNPPPN